MRKLAQIAILTAAATQSGFGATAYWTDWTTGDQSTASGTLTIGAQSVEVGYEGEIAMMQTGGGEDFWIGDAYTTASGNQRPTGMDIIALNGGRTPANKITFSTPVLNPVFAVLSMGDLRTSTDYVFDAPFTILSSGMGYFGSGTLANPSGNILRGQEGHGLIQFSGVFTSISFTVPNYENWHAFQVGAMGIVDPNEPGGIPEPGTIAMTLSGVGLLAIRAMSRNRRESRPTV